MKVLTREDILNANDLVYESADIPEWGGKVYIKGLTGAERDIYEKSNFVKRKGSYDLNLLDIRARLIVSTVCDENHVLLFTPQDIPALQRKNASAIERVCDVARRLAGISREDEEEMATGYEVQANGNGATH